MPEYLYRYWPNTYLCFDNWPSTQNYVLQPTAYRIIKRTPCGAWIDDYGRKRFVNFTAHKQWASEDLERAKIGFIKRKESYVKILRSQLDAAQEQLTLALQNKFDTENIIGL